jgi:hypothetical protein
MCYAAVALAVHDLPPVAIGRPGLLAIGSGPPVLPPSSRSGATSRAEVWGWRHCTLVHVGVWWVRHLVGWQESNLRCTTGPMFQGSRPANSFSPALLSGLR